MVEPAPGESRQEHRREPDATTIDGDDPELLEELSTDSFSSFYSGAASPKVKITTSGEDGRACAAFGE
jgi:hypothetical protein